MTLVSPSSIVMFEIIYFSHSRTYSNFVKHCKTVWTRGLVNLESQEGKGGKIIHVETENKLPNLTKTV